jgi:plastocyanin
VLRLALLTLVVLSLPAASAGGGHGDEATDDHDEGLRSPYLGPGQSWSHVFTEPGRFDYHCHPHPWMVAGLDVVPDTDGVARNITIEFVEPADQDFEAWTLAPTLATAEVGDNVTWVNRGTVPHVVQQTVGEHIEHVGTVGGAGTRATGEHGHDDHTHPRTAIMWIGGAVIAAALLVWAVRRSDPARKGPKGET